MKNYMSPLALAAYRDRTSNGTTNSGLTMMRICDKCKTRRALGSLRQFRAKNKFEKTKWVCVDCLED